MRLVSRQLYFCFLWMLWSSGSDLLQSDVAVAVSRKGNRKTSTGGCTWPKAASLYSFNYLFVRLQTCDVKVKGGDLEGLLYDERVRSVEAACASVCTYTWYRATVAGCQQDIPSDLEDRSLPSAPCVCVCRRTGGSSSRGCWTSTGACADPSGCRCTTTMKGSAPTGVTARNEYIEFLKIHTCGGFKEDLSDRIKMLPLFFPFVINLIVSYSRFMKIDGVVEDGW